MSTIAFRAEITAHEDEMSNLAQNVWENISDTVDEKIADDAWGAVSSQVEDAIIEDAWNAVSDNVYEAAREAAEEYNNNSDNAEDVVSELLRQYNDISVGNHCTIGERATELVTKVIQWHLDTAADEGGLLSSPDVSVQIRDANEGLQRVTVLEAKVAELTGMVSRLEATMAGFRAKHDTPEGVLAYAEATLKHVLIAVQDARGHAVNSGEPF